MSPEPNYPYPPAYYLALVEHAAEPPFESAHEQTTYWGREWGARDEVGPLRAVLMRKLRDEWNVVRDDCWDERAQALMDPAGKWYWDDRKAPTSRAARRSSRASSTRSRRRASRCISSRATTRTTSAASTRATRS